MYGGALPIARNRKSLKRKMTEAEYLDATPEIDAKVAKISAPEMDFRGHGAPFHLSTKY